MFKTDVLIIGAGAAGLFCAGIAKQKGLNVIVIDHASKLAEKVRISGGGRSNFTNIDIDPQQPSKHFISENPRFCTSALSRYSANDFVQWMRAKNVPFHEKHKGQLFCDRSSEDLIQALRTECEAGASGAHVQILQSCKLEHLNHHDQATPYYEALTDQGPIQSQAVVVATGGLSIPQIGASDLGYRLAKQFGLRVTPTRPALVPLVFEPKAWSSFASLSGLSLPVLIEIGQGKKKTSFEEDLLFTHKGLSGPAALQISSYWHEEQALHINLLPHLDLGAYLLTLKQQSKKLLLNELSTQLPNRLAQTWSQHNPDWLKSMPDLSNKSIQNITQSLQNWELHPQTTEGYKKAEVTAGGVDTRDLSQQTMQSKQAGLYFIGEVVDITGWLGGYNFQWAWSSAFACANGLASQLNKL
jgi:predicted Rossmann fold flavoprotein